MKRLLMAATIACALSMTSMAGEIPSGGAPQPQPQPTASSTVLGEIPTSGEAQPITDAAIFAILTALGLASF
jgi:hypothetical protein